MKPLTMENLMDLEVQTLSGGELQRVAIVLALGKPADVCINLQKFWKLHGIGQLPV